MLSPLGVSSKRMIGSSWFLAGLLRLIYTEFYGNLGILETKDAPHWSFVENLKKCIVINDKSLDIIAKHLRRVVLLYYKFIIQFAGERIFFINW